MRLLLDSHLPAALARQLQRHGIDVVALADWMDGSQRTASDDHLLSLAYTDQRVLVTCDCQTIPPLLKDWAQMGQHHGGVILVDQHTLRANDIGGLFRALRKLVEQSGEEDWQDQVVFLRWA